MYILEEATGASDVCTGLAPVLRIVGIVVWGIKVIVPIILIVIGMIDLAKAVTEKSEDKSYDECMDCINSPWSCSVNGEDNGDDDWN